jgi:hypothetical protein
MAIARISERDGKLISEEAICHQTYGFNCKSGCTPDTKSVIHPGADAFFTTVKAVPRTLTLSDDGTLRAESSTLLAGFDSSTDKKLPDKVADSRVWDSDQSTAGREGLLMQAVVVVKYTLFKKVADCRYSMVQEFKSEWDTKLAQSGGAFVLSDKKEIPLVRDKVVAFTKILAAEGRQDAKDADCQGDSAQDESKTPGKYVLRFQKVDSNLKQCPDTKEYDRLLPADPL